MGNEIGSLLLSDHQHGQDAGCCNSRRSGGEHNVMKVVDVTSPAAGKKLHGVGLVRFPSGDLLLMLSPVCALMARRFAREMRYSCAFPPCVEAFEGYASTEQTAAGWLLARCPPKS